MYWSACEDAAWTASITEYVTRQVATPDAIGLMAKFGRALDC